MPPKRTNEPAFDPTSVSATLPTTFDVFDVRHIEELGQNKRAIMIYFLNTIKYSSEIMQVYYRAPHPTDPTRAVLCRVPSKLFIDKYLMAKKNIHDLFKAALRPFALIFNPSAPLVDNENRTINLYSRSIITLTNYDHVPSDKCTNAKRFIEFLFKNLFHPDDKDARAYVAWWCMQVINGVRPKTALVLSGVQGTGKSTFAQLLCKLVGEHMAFGDASPEDIMYCAPLHGKSLVVVNELNVADAKMQGRFKTLVTEDSISFNAKNKGTFQSNNYSSFIVTSNDEKLTLKKSLNGRRYFHCHPRDLRKSLNKAEICEFKECCLYSTKDDIFAAALYHVLLEYMPKDAPSGIPEHCIEPEPEIESENHQPLAPISATTPPATTEEMIMMAECLCILIAKNIPRLDVNGRRFFHFRMKQTDIYKECLKYFLEDKRMKIPNKNHFRNQLYSFLQTELGMESKKSSEWYMTQSMTVLFDKLYGGIPSNNEALQHMIEKCEPCGLVPGLSYDEEAERCRNESPMESSPSFE